MAKKGTCAHCELSVRARAADGVFVAAVHESPNGTMCPGTGLLLAGFPKPAARKKQPPRRGSRRGTQTGKKSSKAAKHSRSAKKKLRTRAKLSPQERATIEASEALERAAWDSAQRWDLGGQRSVRTVSGGAPTLGKRR